MNIAIVIGNLVGDPEIKHTASGVIVANFTIANNRVVKGEKKPSFLNCVAFNKTAEILEKYCKKGHKIGVNAEIVQESWENDAGEKRSKIVLNVNRLEMLTPKTTQSNDSGSNSNDDLQF